VISHSSSQKIGFLGEADFETKSVKGRRNSEIDYSCSEFYCGFNGAKTGFLSPTVREIFVNENGGKSGNLEFAPPEWIAFLGPQAE
jgi:hypothetical protein